MAERKHIAVLDIGKTNVKVILLDLATGAELGVVRRANTVIEDGLFPHFDIDAIWTFFRDTLAAFEKTFGIDAISITTHGASIVLLDADGTLAFPVLDYEYAGPEEIRASYDVLRPSFSETFSPRLPNGLNVGAQLYWLQQTFPAEFSRVATILTYPQYWAFRLCGVVSNEVTSLGCHTDLWNVPEGRLSTLVEGQGWAPLFAPVRSAFDVLGCVTSGLAERMGMGGREIPVYSGLHDSNASLLPHLGRPAPFSVLSTGTWVVAFAVGGTLHGVAQNRDCFSNVDAFGRPVPSGRFMGGREFERIVGKGPVSVSEAAVLSVLEAQAVFGPGLAPGTGPFPHAPFGWSVDPNELTIEQKAATGGLYLAFMTETVLGLLGADGPIIVEGPLGANQVFLEALAGLTGRDVLLSEGQTGTSIGASLLAGGKFSIPETASHRIPPPNWAAKLAPMRAIFHGLALEHNVFK